MGEQLPQALADVAEIVMGQSPAGETCNRDGVGVPLLNGPTEFGPHHPHATQFTVDPKKHSQPGDILFCVRGSTTGRMNWSDRSYAIGRGIAAIRHKEKIEIQPLVRSIIEHNLADLLQAATGSTFPNVSATQLAEIPYPAIDQEEQLRIASLFGALDDKIELNRRTNETLEAMARALFRDWFVDFGPTRAKMEGRDPYLAPDLWALFPDRIDDETGLPEGWTYSTVGERFDVKIGRTPPRKEDWHFTDGSSGVPWLSIRDLSDCGVYVHETSEGLTEKSIADCRVPLVEAGTVLVSFKLTVGRVAIAERAMATNEAIAHLNSIDLSPSPFLSYCWMNDFDYSTLGSTSSIATAVNSKLIKGMKFPKFGNSIEQCFASQVGPLFKLIAKSAGETRSLAHTRDLLLPKLMSGEIRLRDAEKAAGEALA